MRGISSLPHRGFISGHYGLDRLNLQVRGEEEWVAPMWDETYTSVCRHHPDVIAAFESPYGRLALLLRQTLIPLLEDRARWLDDTRRVARAVVANLRSAGLVDDVTILQWQPLRQVAHVMRRWDCCYESDTAGDAELGDDASAFALTDGSRNASSGS